MVQKLRGWTKDHRVIRDVHVLRGRYLGAGMAAKGLADREIRNIYRRGKYIVFELDHELDDESYWLVCHNAMSGFWDAGDDPWTFDYVEGKRKSSDSDVRVQILITDGRGSARMLRFHDARLFGSLNVYGNLEPVESMECLPPFREMGPEAILTPCVGPAPMGQWNALDLAVTADAGKKTIKEVLMEQKNVAGIGNIYASEGLWLAGVDPRRVARTLNSEEIWRVHANCQNVLKTAIESKLDYSIYLNVYRREECLTCGSGISVEKIKGRSTYFCERCQK